MAGLDQPNVVDLVTHDPASGEFALIMIQTQPWSNEPGELQKLREKINNYAAFARGGDLVSKFPEAAGKPVRIQLDCNTAPSGRVADLVNLAVDRLQQSGLRFVVNILATREPPT